MFARIDALQRQIDELEKHIEAETLLQDIWLELGPYTQHISKEVRNRMRDYFNFDDSE